MLMGVLSDDPCTLIQLGNGLENQSQTPPVATTAARAVPTGSPILRLTPEPVPEVCYDLAEPTAPTAIINPSWRSIVLAMAGSAARAESFSSGPTTSGHRMRRR